jgi:hypothetical protein
VFFCGLGLGKEEIKMKTLWTFENADGLYDGEFETLSEAQDRAYEIFDQRIEDDFYPDYISRISEDVVFLERYYDETLDEDIVITRIEQTLREDD